MTEKLRRARTFGDLVRGTMLAVVGVRLVLTAVAELRAPAEVVDLPVQADESPKTTPAHDPEAPAPA